MIFIGIRWMLFIRSPVKLGTIFKRLMTESLSWWQNSKSTSIHSSSKTTDNSATNFMTSNHFWYQQRKIITNIIEDRKTRWSSEFDDLRSFSDLVRVDPRFLKSVGPGPEFILRASWLFLWRYVFFDVETFTEIFIWKPVKNVKVIKT